MKDLIEINKMLFLAGVIIFENRNLPVITLRTKTSNRDTEKSQKVHSFGPLICEGLEIWFVASLYRALQIHFVLFGHFMAGNVPKNGGHIGLFVNQRALMG